MNISKVLLALTSALLTVATAHAQLSAYGTVSVRRMTSVPFVQAGTTFTNGSFNPVGATGGIFYDFRTYGPVRLGAEIRGSIVNSTQSAYPNFNAGGGHIASGLGGVRASFHTPFVPLKPYVNGMVGVARTNFGVGFNNALATEPGGPSKETGILTTTHLEYDVFAGVDYAILPVVDWRVEFGYGGIQGSEFNYPVQSGPGHTFPLQSISTGIVFHLPFGLGKF